MKHYFSYVFSQIFCSIFFHPYAMNLKTLRTKLIKAHFRFSYIRSQTFMRNFYRKTTRYKFSATLECLKNLREKFWSSDQEASPSAGKNSFEEIPLTAVCPMVWMFFRSLVSFFKTDIISVKVKKNYFKVRCHILLQPTSLILPSFLTQ